MPRLAPHSPCRIAICLIALALFGGTGTGCRKLDTNKEKDEAYEGPDAEWGKKYRRKKSGEPAPYFLDEKGSQIERSLGL